MKVYKPVYNVVLRECPGEISIGFMAAGCKQGCKDCSYKSLERYGTEELQISKFKEILSDNSGLATTVLFMGGEWNNDFCQYLDIAKSMGYKTCLYTGLKGLEDVPDQISSRLDFCKTGKWMGIPLTNPDTNQRFWDVQNKQDLTHKFQTSLVVE